MFQENPNKLKSIQIDRFQLIFLLNPSTYPWLTILQLYHMTEYPVSHPIQLSRVIQTCFRPISLSCVIQSIQSSSVIHPVLYNLPLISCYSPYSIIPQ